MAKVGDLRVKCARGRVVRQEIDRLTAERKKLYEEHDELVAALRKYEEPLIGIRLKRTFESGNTQWGHGPVRELVIEIDEPPAAPKDTKKKAAAK